MLGAQHLVVSDYMVETVTQYRVSEADSGKNRAAE